MATKEEDLQKEFEEESTKFAEQMEPYDKEARRIIIRAVLTKKDEERGIKVLNRTLDQMGRKATENGWDAVRAGFALSSAYRTFSGDKAISAALKLAKVISQNMSEEDINRLVDEFTQ